MFAQEASQEKQLIYYSADIISADLVTQEALLKGNVKILFDNYELTAKEARISRKTFSLTAKKEIRIEGNDSLIEADEIELNYKTRVGKIKNARITSGQLLLRAEKVTKLSNEIFEAENGSFTTCNTCPPGWRIKAKKIKTNINKYIDLRGARLQILNTSILPIPRIVMPLNTRRKSGFLFPEFTVLNRRLGLEISQPYFWALTPHSDLTFAPKLYFNIEDLSEPMSAKTHFEYRHLLGSESRLNLKFDYMYDATYEDINRQEDEFLRYSLSYENYFKLPGQVTQKTKLTLIRDRNYLADFQHETFGLNEASLLNRFTLDKTYKNSFGSAEFLYNINLLKENPQANNEDAIHKAPELSYSFLERSILGDFLSFKNDFTYTNFARNSASFDTVNESPTTPFNPNADLQEKEIIENNGQFDASKDLLRTGHRLRVNSELSAPFRIGKIFDVLPALNYRDSYYRFNVNPNDATGITANDPYDDFAFSRYFEGKISLRTELSRVYNKKYKHKIMPEFIYRHGTPVEQSDNVFFRSQEDLAYHRRNRPISDFDFFDFDHGIQFDYWDRFFRAELAEINITNVIITKNYQDNIAFYDQPLYFNIRQGYDFKNAREQTGAARDPLSNLEATLKFRFKHVHTLTRASHYHEAKKTDLSTRTRFIYRPGKFIQLSYNSTNILDENNDPQSRAETAGFALGWEFPTLQVQGRINYSLTDDKDLGWQVGLNYTPKGRCWDIRLNIDKPNGVDEPNTKLSANFNLGPDNNYKKTLFKVNNSLQTENKN